MSPEDIIYNAARGFARGLVESLAVGHAQQMLPPAEPLGGASDIALGDSVPHQSEVLPDIDYNGDRGIIDIEDDPLNPHRHGPTRVHFVSRHDIAETGLICPSCHNTVAPRASFDKIQRVRLSDGSVNEALFCPHTKEHDGHKVPCGAILVASPDTEHGDHLSKHTEKNYTFRRKAADVAVREEHGADVETRGDRLSSDLVAVHPLTPVQPELMRNARVAAGLEEPAESDTPNETPPPADGSTGIAWGDVNKSSEDELP